MRETIEQGVLNGGINAKIFVLASKAENMSSQIGRLVTVQVAQCLITGELKKITASIVKPKEEGAEKDAYKCIDIEVESIQYIDDDNSENLVIELPDKKALFDAPVTINYYPAICMSSIK